MRDDKTPPNVRTEHRATMIELLRRCQTEPGWRFKMLGWARAEFVKGRFVHGWDLMCAALGIVPRQKP